MTQDFSFAGNGLTRVSMALARAYGQVAPFIHMRAITYLAAGGPMITVEVR